MSASQFSPGTEQVVDQIMKARTDNARTPAAELGTTPRPRLLFLAYYFPPARVIASVRTNSIAKWLARSGWQVTVVTPRASTWRKVESVDEVDSALAREGVQCLRISHPWTSLAPRYTVPRYEKRGWMINQIGSRVALVARKTARQLSIPPEIGWIREAEKVCNRLRTDDVDLILASGGPFAVFGLARRISVRLRRPYVLDYRDLWSEHPFAHLRQTREPSFENESRPLTGAAAIIGVSPTMIRILERKFQIGPKAHVIPNGYDPETLTEVVPHDFRHFAIVYAGQFHPPKSAITPLMAALARLRTMGASSDNWAFHYYGRQPDHVREEAIRFGLDDRVVLHGEVLRREALSAIRGAGIAVVISSIETDASPGEKGIVTGKIFEAIGLRTPLLVIAPPGSDLESVLETAGLGRRFSGSEVEAMASYLADTIAGHVVPPAFPEKFEWNRLGADLDHLLRGVLRGIATTDFS